MRLDYNCLRAVLLDLEEMLQFPDGDDIEFPVVSLEEICSGTNLEDYSQKEVFYTLYNLEQAGLIRADILWASDVLNECAVVDITYAGHMFLKSIKDEKVWKKTKTAVGKVTDVSLAVLTEIAKRFAIGLIFPTT